MLLCNALIQLHFYFRCSSWFFLFKKYLKTELQKTQNKCTHFCLSLPPRSCSNPLHFRKINWFREDNRVEYCIENTVFKYWNELVPEYIHSTRSQMALSITLWKTNTEEKSFILLRAKNMIKKP